MNSLVFIGSAITLAATSLGALPALFLHHRSERTNNILMGFSAGIMLSASSFSLIIPSLHLSADQTGSRILGALIVAMMILFGSLFLFLCDRF